jgi:hypothetical protein
MRSAIGATLPATAHALAREREHERRLDPSGVRIAPPAGLPYANLDAVRAKPPLAARHDLRVVAMGGHDPPRRNAVEAELHSSTTRSSRASWPIESVPGKSACSPLESYAIAGATIAAGLRSAARSARARAMVVSVSSGRCGPCCSVELAGIRRIESQQKKSRRLRLK